MPRTATRRCSVTVLEVERTFELVFEQPLDHADALLDLDGEGALGQSRRGRRAEQIGPLEGTVPFRQGEQLLLGHLLEERQGLLEIAGG